MDFFLLISSFPWALPGNALPERLPPRHPRQSLDPAFDFRLCVLELGWHGTARETRTILSSFPWALPFLSYTSSSASKSSHKATRYFTGIRTQRRMTRREPLVQCVTRQSLVTRSMEIQLSRLLLATPPRFC